MRRLVLSAIRPALEKSMELEAAHNAELAELKQTLESKEDQIKRLEASLTERQNELARIKGADINWDYSSNGTCLVARSMASG